MLERLGLSNQTVIALGVVLGLMGSLLTYSFAVFSRDTDLVIYNDPTLDAIVVEIRGQVANPGVYRMEEGERLADLIARAGGPLPDADMSSINQARRPDDAEVVEIPQRSAATPIVAALPDTVPSDGISYRININTASQPELESLPGIGPVIAARIIEYRQTNRPFTSISQLSAVEGISESLIDEIETLITVGP